MLRQRAEQRLAQALQAPGSAVSAAAAVSCHQPQPPRPPQPLQPALVALTARQRAERRAVRLFIHAPQCRELLSCLSLQDPSCLVALEWLSNLALVSVDGAIAPMVLPLTAQLPGAVGAVLAQAAAPAPEVMAVLERDPQGELQALLDCLEPVG